MKFFLQKRSDEVFFLEVQTVLRSQYLVFIFKAPFFKIYLYVCVFGGVHVSGSPVGAGYPGAGVLYEVVAGNLTLVLWKSSKYF